LGETDECRQVATAKAHHFLQKTGAAEEMPPATACSAAPYMRDREHSGADSVGGDLDSVKDFEIPRAMEAKSEEESKTGPPLYDLLQTILPGSLGELESAPQLVGAVENTEAEALQAVAEMLTPKVNEFLESTYWEHPRRIRHGPVDARTLSLAATERERERELVRAVCQALSSGNHDLTGVENVEDEVRMAIAIDNLLHQESDFPDLPEIANKARRLRLFLQGPESLPLSLALQLMLLHVGLMTRAITVLIPGMLCQIAATKSWQLKLFYDDGTMKSFNDLRMELLNQEDDTAAKVRQLIYKQVQASRRPLNAI